MIRNKPYIIAELGVNWERPLVAEGMINDLADKGADAVKFQCFSELEVDNERLMAFSLDLEHTIRFKRHAHEADLEFLCTPMYEDAVHMLAPHVDRWKIREKDSTGGTIFQTIAVNYNNRLIINSKHEPPYGGKFNLSHKRTIYCVPEYPTKPHMIDYTCMKDSHGFSCHCPEMSIWENVEKTKPEIVEIHVTPEKNGKHPDDSVSYELDNFSKIVSILK